MPQGGRLVLHTENVAFDKTSMEFEPGNYVALIVSDNGSGIDEDMRERIFEPFFTTKETGLGTGLGLSTCERIITESGGRITFDSQLGHGTVFRIYLPGVEA
jgi:signal transduction histidine kinase